MYKIQLVVINKQPGHLRCRLKYRLYIYTKKNCSKQISSHTRFIIALVSKLNFLFLFRQAFMYSLSRLHPCMLRGGNSQISNRVQKDRAYFYALLGIFNRISTLIFKWLFMGVFLWIIFLGNLFLHLTLHLSSKSAHAFLVNYQDLLSHTKTFIQMAVHVYKFRIFIMPDNQLMQ